MKQILAWLVAALLAIQPAYGLTPSQKPVVLNGIQSWSLSGSSSDLFFARNAGSCAINRIAVPCSSQYAITRASQESCLWSDNHISTAANGVACITDLGAGIWQGSTNQALRSRDMTNATWVKVNMTAALTATGVDNAANSASTLTASAGNATVLQTLTIVSMAETYSVYVKRITGTGEIDITENNGGTWTALTTSNCFNTSGTGTAVNANTYVRCLVEATLANPVIGLRIVTNGDSIAADFNQDEELAFATPPILTTSATVARAADVITLQGAALTAALSAKAARFVTNTLQQASGNTPYVLHYGGGAFMYFGSATAMNIFNGTTAASVTIGNSGSWSSLVKSAFGMDASSYTVTANGGAKTTQATAWADNTGTIAIGSDGSGGHAINGYLLRATFGPTKGMFDGMTTGTNQAALETGVRFAWTSPIPANDNIERPKRKAA